MTGIPNLWDKKRIWPVVLAVVIVIMVILGGFFCYVRFTSYSSTSEDGMWQAGAYRPELSVNLWSGYR